MEIYRLAELNLRLLQRQLCMDFSLGYLTTNNLRWDTSLVYISHVSRQPRYNTGVCCVTWRHR